MEADSLNSKFFPTISQNEKCVNIKEKNCPAVSAGAKCSRDVVGVPCLDDLPMGSSNYVEGDKQMIVTSEITSQAV